ncbi:sensor histidine kinase [Virgibacillus oceani]
MDKNKRSFSIFPKKYGYFPHVFLIYLLLPAYYIISESGWKALIGWGLLLLFLVSYRQLYSSFETNAFTYWIIVQLGIVFIFAVYFNINNVFLGFFTSYFLGWYRSNKLFYPIYSLYALALSLPLIIKYETQIQSGSYYYFIYLVIMFIVPFGIKSMNSRMELEEELDIANNRIEELVKQEERMRISRDLHDTLGHTLSLITLKSQLVSKLAEKDPNRAKLEAREVERTSRTALKQVRELVSDMRSVSITEALLEAASILESADISYHFEGEVNAANIPGISQNILSMCIKEAVTNIVKHSMAKNCTVILEQTAGEVRLIIEDDGIGLLENKNNGNGIDGMSERLALVDGKLKIQAEDGTRLEFIIPVVEKDGEMGAS